MASNELAVMNGAALAGFESTALSKVHDREAGATAAVAREEAELKAGIFLARQFPRDDAAAYTKIVKSCRRPGFAEGARYSFPRGSKQVSGPSVRMAREIARCWGNVRYGLRMVAIDEETVHIRGYAHDLETNAYVEHEDKFARLIQRKNNGRTEWVKPDERDLRELVNRRGAILVRNAILQVVPPDVVEDAERVAQQTLVQAARGEIEQGREEAIRRLALAFDGIAVSTEMLVDYLGHELEDITAEEIADLRSVYTSIKEGNTKRADHFEAKRKGDGGASLNERLKTDDAPQHSAATGETPGWEDDFAKGAAEADAAKEGRKLL